MKKGKKMQQLFPPTCEQDLAFVTAMRRAGIIEEALRQHGVEVEARPELKQQYCWQVTRAHTWYSDDDLPNLAPFADELAVALDVGAVAVRHDPYDSVCFIHEQFELPTPPGAAERAEAQCLLAGLRVALRALDVPQPHAGTFLLVDDHASRIAILEYADAALAEQAATGLQAAGERLRGLMDFESCTVQHQGNLMILLIDCLAGDKPATAASEPATAASEPAAPAAG